MFHGDFFGPTNIMRSVLCNLLSTSCLSSVGHPERSLLCVFGCYGSGCLSLISLCTLAVHAAHRLSSCEILVFFLSFYLICSFVTPSSSLSCDNENPDCFMTKHGLSTQPHSAYVKCHSVCYGNFSSEPPDLVFVLVVRRIFLLQMLCIGVQWL